MKRPCQHGECLPPRGISVHSGYFCKCHEGWQGAQCDTRVSPCDGDPCLSKGICHVTGDTTFRCQCYAWWEGNNIKISLSLSNTFDKELRL